jgi:hypothetical protein
MLRLLTRFFQPLFFGGNALRFLLSVHLDLRQFHALAESRCQKPDRQGGPVD